MRASDRRDRRVAAVDIQARGLFVTAKSKVAAKLISAEAMNKAADDAGRTPCTVSQMFIRPMPSSSEDHLDHDDRRRGAEMRLPQGRARLIPYTSGQPARHAV
jgi:hypothetical protein